MKDRFPHYWMCSTCAKNQGGVWPKGHVATVSLIKCEYCDGKNHLPDEGIAPWVDYDWPEKRKASLVAQVSRD